MNRRGFLGAMLAACAAPAFVKAEILMPVRKIIVPEALFWLRGDGITDDSAALHAMIRGESVILPDGSIHRGHGGAGGDVFIPPGNYAMGAPLHLPQRAILRGSNLIALPSLSEGAMVICDGGSVVGCRLMVNSRSTAISIAAPKRPSCGPRRRQRWA